MSRSSAAARSSTTGVSSGCSRILRMAVTDDFTVSCTLSSCHKATSGISFNRVNIVCIGTDDNTYMIESASSISPVIKYQIARFRILREKALSGIIAVNALYRADSLPAAVKTGCTDLFEDIPYEHGAPWLPRHTCRILESASTFSFIFQCFIDNLLCCCHNSFPLSDLFCS